MGRIRTFLELGLAGGAAIGIFALSRPQFLGGGVDMQPSSAVPTIGEESMAATPTRENRIASQENVAIAHFLGIAQFVKSPTEYGFICDSASGKARGEVVSASLEGDRMEIEYRYSTSDTTTGTTKIGKLIGTLNSDGVFAGIYRTSGEQTASDKTTTDKTTSNKTTAVQGEITFTFAADGSAKGSSDQGKGSVQIFL